MFFARTHPRDTRWKTPTECINAFPRRFPSSPAIGSRIGRFQSAIHVSPVKSWNPNKFWNFNVSSRFYEIIPANAISAFGRIWLILKYPAQSGREVYFRKRARSRASSVFGRISTRSVKICQYLTGLKLIRDGKALFPSGRCRREQMRDLSSWLELNISTRERTTREIKCRL